VLPTAARSTGARNGNSPAVVTLPQHQHYAMRSAICGTRITGQQRWCWWGRRNTRRWAVKTQAAPALRAQLAQWLAEQANESMSDHCALDWRAVSNHSLDKRPIDSPQNSHLKQVFQKARRKATSTAHLCTIRSYQPTVDQPSPTSRLVLSIRPRAGKAFGSN